MVLGDLVDVEVDVDHLGIVGEDVAQDREDLGQDVGAADQVDIAALHQRQAGRAEHVAGHALVERMAVAHVQLAGVRLPDFSAQ